MSTPAPAVEWVQIEVDGVPMKAPKGAMIIQVTDEAGVYIPRFCYHKKLPIAANCRMCLVEVEKSPKPLPACATPVAEGMKIFTRSAKALAAQRAVMEFLLINHPLDCPICDQGGECELQDLSLGYGRSISRFTEKKRAVKDKNLGPLIATEMTRCIHCTRCIRFLEVIAGEKELGATGRGEHVEIGTFVERPIESELSGNVIDVCPVGALTSKPFRFSARAWEMEQHASIAAHDGVGSNVYVHTTRKGVMRVVPRENESVNEVWLSDRDRFSYTGLYSADRARDPWLRGEGAVEWDQAFAVVAQRLREVVERHGADRVGVLLSPSLTTEEHLLAARLARALGSGHVDHRLRFGAPSSAAASRVGRIGLGQRIADLERIGAALVIGGDVRKDQPLIAHRLRKAARAGARISRIDPIAFAPHFAYANTLRVAPQEMVAALAAVAAAVAADGGARIGPELERRVQGAAPEAVHRAIAADLAGAPESTVLLGAIAIADPSFPVLHALAEWIARHTGSRLGFLPLGANHCGATLVGAVPDAGALDANTMAEADLKACILVGVEPEYDCWDPHAWRAALERAECVIALTAFAGEELQELAHAILPIAAVYETEGSMIHLGGDTQRFAAAAPPPGQARPGWKVLRRLGAELALPGFDFVGIDDLQSAMQRAPGAAAEPGASDAPDEAPPAAGLVRVGTVPAYRVDALTRRAAPLQAMPDAGTDAARLHPDTAARLGITDGQRVRVRQGAAQAVLSAAVDARVAPDAVWIECTHRATRTLGPMIGPVELTPESGGAPS